MTNNDYFNMSSYEGIMKSRGTEVGKASGNTNPSDTGRMGLMWKTLFRALRLSQGSLEAGEELFIGENRGRRIYEYKSSVSGKNAPLYVLSHGGAIEMGYVTIVEDEDPQVKPKFAIEPVACTDKDALGDNIGVDLHFTNFLETNSNFKKDHIDNITALKKLVAKKDFINVTDWKEMEIAEYVQRVGELKNALVNKKELYEKLSGHFGKITEKNMEDVLSCDWTPIMGKTATLKTEVKAKKKSDLTYRKDKNGFLIAKPENWIAPVDPKKDETPDRGRTPEELARIPQIQNISVDDRAKKYYNAIMKTVSVPFRNFYLLGGAGIGKSTMCRVLAFMLGLPYSDTTCFAEMEMTDILGGVFPINNEDSRALSEDFYNSVYDELGVSLDMLRDETSYALAYEILTGEQKKSVTENEVFSIFIQKVSEKVAKLLPEKKNEGIVYKYIPSELVKSISSDGIGGLHEIKEPTVIRNEGVLVGLNTLLAEGTLTLPNGEVVTRNPNSVIIMTSNADYAGCQELNESVISRMHMVDNMDFLTASEMSERAKQIFGDALEENYYSVMAQVVKQVEAWISADDGNMGIASFREYQNWIEYTLKVYDSPCPTKEELIETAEKTIKFKASQNKENLENGFEACYQPLNAL